jgi:hypothetical protein
VNGRHRDAAPPYRKAISDQPIAQPLNEVTDMLAGDSPLYNPLNMIANF